MTAATATSPALSFAEKSFYLDEFHAHTLCFSTSLGDCGEAGLGELFGLCRQLIANDTRVILLVGRDERRRPAINGLRRMLRNEVLGSQTARFFPTRNGRPSLAGVVQAVGPRRGEEDLLNVWDSLRRTPLFVGLVPDKDLLETGQWLTGRLRMLKWVVLEPEGGLAWRNGSQISFMDDSMLTELLRTGAAEWSGVDQRRQTLEAVQKALRTGVQAVNLCAVDQVATELFTYEGSGTLFTLEDYCRIERLGIDDFEEVERLLDRGRSEGFLKGRDRNEIGTILLNGFGATIGQHHLAGVCGLLTKGYERSQAGEIAGLYTFTRFKSEGIGGRLLARIVEEARQSGLRYLFACTTDANAAQFFERHGFGRVPRSAVPAAKWRGYDRQRVARLAVLRMDLA